MPRSGSGPGGNVTGTTNSFGVWQIESVPEGIFTVAPELGCHEFVHILGSSPAGPPPITIEVNAANQAQNQSIQFLATRDLLFDMNWDGFISIVGEVEPFVRVVYFGHLDWYAQQFPGKDPLCPGDCNGDGFLSIIGDVPCFVDCVYFGDCSAHPSMISPQQPLVLNEPNGALYTIGGAVYTGLASPLTSGLAGVEVTMEGDAGPFTATTAGGQGLWMIQGIPSGAYSVHVTMEGRCFTQVISGEPQGSSSTDILVNDNNQAANQSIQFLAGQRIAADLNGDCRVNGDDFTLFQACASGPSMPYPEIVICQTADFDHDLDVDQADFGRFQRCLTGNDIVTNLECAN